MSSADIGEDGEWNIGQGHPTMEWYIVNGEHFVSLLGASKERIFFKPGSYCKVMQY
jgi:hypothetical protein